MHFRSSWIQDPFPLFFVCLYNTVEVMERLAQMGRVISQY